MSEPTITVPEKGHAFKHKETGEVYLALFIGTGDSIKNYDEITKEEYDEIQILLAEKQKREMFPH